MGRLPSPSVLERIEDVGARHGDRERAQAVLDLHRAVVTGEHLRQAPIGLRRLIEIAAEQHYAALAQPRLHLVGADATRRDDLAGLAVTLAARLVARHHAAGAVDGRVVARRRTHAFDAGQDHGVIAHGAADEAALAREGRRRALAHHPQFAFAMAFPPGVIVVVVHAVGDGAADDRAHALDHPFAARIGVAAGKLHGGEVALAELRGHL